MPENTTTTQSADISANPPTNNLTAEKGPEISPSHEQIPASQPDSQNSTFEKIQRAGSKVLEDFGIIRRGRGRPRLDGLPKKSDVVAGPGAELPQPGATISGQSTVVSMPAVDNSKNDALFARSIGSAIKGAFSFLKNLIRKKAGQAGIEKDFTEKTLQECEVEPQVQADFNEALQIVLEKYQVKTEYAPEIALAVAVGRMAGPYVLLLQTFNAEIERRKKEGK